MTEPPADAYYVMAEILGEQYFHREPKDTGVLHIRVVGIDGVATEWIIPATLGYAIHRELCRYPHIRGRIVARA